MYRTRLYRRQMRAKNIKRKKHICTSTGWYCHFDGMLSKGKVHCSCPLCARKSTKEWGLPTNSAVVRPKQLLINDLKAKEQMKGDDTDAVYSLRSTA